MKAQTFITRWEDENHKLVDFERWSCKRLSTVVKKTLLLAEHPIYRECNEHAIRIAIYRTPDGFTREDQPCWSIGTNEL